MIPLEIEIVLWYGTRAVDYREGDFSAPAVRQTIDEFKGDLQLLELNAECCDRTYQLTERGHVYFDALQALQLPKRIWVMLE